MTYWPFITVRNSSCGKVIFSQESVCLRGGVYANMQWAGVYLGMQWGRGLSAHGGFAQGVSMQLGVSAKLVDAKWLSTTQLPPRRPLKQALRILLECIIVWKNKQTLSFGNIWTLMPLPVNIYYCYSYFIQSKNMSWCSYWNYFGLSYVSLFCQRC